MRVPASLLTLALFLLAGCAVEDGGDEETSSGGPDGPGATATDKGDDARTPSATLKVAHNGTERAWDVPFDPESRPAAPAYTGGFAHPDGFTAHDLLVTWSQQTGETFNVTYSDAYGHSLEAIAGTAAWSGETGGWFWRLDVNGVASQVGISGAPVADGDTVRFVYAPWGDQEA